MKGDPNMKIKYFIPVAACILMLCGCADTSYLEESSASDSSVTESVSDSSAEVKKSSSIFVQIEGAVKSPGVYEMSEGDRVFALIEKAGGFREDACTTDINQAEALSDGQKIIVMTKKEQKASNSSGSGNGSGASSDGKIDINQADAAELTTISGIGPMRADAIIAYREQNGRFKKPEDITKVSGIGESTYSRIKDRIKV